MLKKILLFLMFSSSALADPVHIVAAENFYGQIAEKIGGPYVEVTNILSNPSQDPHLFSMSPSHAKAISTADLIIYNGIHYDPWMEKIIADRNTKQHILVVAEVAGKKSGDNPHIWYDPETMLRYAKALTQQLSELDPAHQTYFQQRLSQFNAQYQSLMSLVKTLKQRYAGTPVIATEPVFNYMADALGFRMQGLEFQLKVMNETEPSIAEIKDFEKKLSTHAVKLLIYNDQVTSPLTEYLKNQAASAQVATVGVSEIKPQNQDYVDWMKDQLSRVAQALR